MAMEAPDIEAKERAPRAVKTVFLTAPTAVAVTRLRAIMIEPGHTAC